MYDFKFLLRVATNMIPFFLISWSEQYIQSNTAGLLLSVAPIFTLFLSPLLTNDDKFTLQKLISITFNVISTLGSFGQYAQSLPQLKDCFTLLPNLSVY